MCSAPWGCFAMAVGMSGMMSSLLGPATLEDVLDIGRHDPRRGAIDMFLEQRLAAGRLQVELDGVDVRAAPRLQHEPCRGTDLASSPVRHEQAAAFHPLADLVHLH